MDFDDEFDDAWEDEFGGQDEQSGDEIEEDTSLFESPLKAYMLLSDDAQDEIEGGKKIRLRCLLCSHKFGGSIGQACPACFSARTELVEQHDSNHESF